MKNVSGTGRQPRALWIKFTQHWRLRFGKTNWKQSNSASKTQWLYPVTTYAFEMCEIAVSFWKEKKKRFVVEWPHSFLSRKLKIDTYALRFLSLEQGNGKDWVDAYVNDKAVCDKDITM